MSTSTNPGGLAGDYNGGQVQDGTAEKSEGEKALVQVGIGIVQGVLRLVFSRRP